MIIKLDEPPPPMEWPFKDGDIVQTSMGPAVYHTKLKETTKTQEKLLPPNIVPMKRVRK